ncbi:MAG: hypothetical protein SGARI_001965 [Bacillariaceae sp.]
MYVGILLSLASSLDLSVAYPLDQQLLQKTRLKTSRRRPTAASSSSSFSSAGGFSFPFFQQPVVEFEAHIRSSTLWATNDDQEESKDDEDAADIKENGGDDETSSTAEAIVNEAVGKLKKKLMKRVTRLEDIIARQEIELYRLKQKANDLTEVSEAFTNLLQLLREAGLDADTLPAPERQSSSGDQSDGSLPQAGSSESSSSESKDSTGRVIESFDEEIIFGTAPSSVSDAADAAGAAILAAMLGGKQRMLIDVRDAELSTVPETLVQFIELAILPIAAGLEGLKSTRNRVKIVFPKVSQLLEYRRTMALAAPEVVALSTLGFDPVEDRDQLVVIVAPEPDDEEGINAIKELLHPTSADTQPIRQPVVVLNYHMIPFQGVDLDFETAYHLRLLTVQYMSDGVAEEYIKSTKNGKDGSDGEDITFSGEPRELEVVGDDVTEEGEEDVTQTDEEALESAMKHAHELGNYTSHDNSSVSSSLACLR